MPARFQIMIPKELHDRLRVAAARLSAYQGTTTMKEIAIKAVDKELTRIEKKLG